MTVRTARGQVVTEDVGDAATWLRMLTGCPPVTRTVQARCRRPAHGNEPGEWFYVEADRSAGVARLRCLACAHVQPLLDSEVRWTYPSAYSCSTCAQAIAEVVYGISESDGVATWLVLAARCVGCGTVDGLTDLVVTPVSAEVLAAAL